MTERSTVIGALEGSSSMSDEIFSSVFSQAADLLGSDQEVARLLEISLPSVRRWRMGASAPTPLMRAAVCRRLREKLTGIEHEHQFGDRFPGSYWPIKCRTPDCSTHQGKNGRVFDPGPRVDCPKGCGLAYYSHEADEHSCWDS